VGAGHSRTSITAAAPIPRSLMAWAGNGVTRADSGRPAAQRFGGLVAAQHPAGPVEQQHGHWQASQDGGETRRLDPRQLQPEPDLHAAGQMWKQPLQKPALDLVETRRRCPEGAGYAGEPVA
jgi:hypothetical protein